MSPRKPRRGRPPRSDRAATERIEIRATKAERVLFERAAKAAETTLSEWLRGVAMRAATSPATAAAPRPTPS